MEKAKHEVVVATWPAEAGYGFFGGQDYSGYRDESSGAYIPLRAVVEGDKYPFLDDQAQAVNGMVVYIWFDSGGTLSLDLRCASRGHAKLSEAESSLKMFRKLSTKMNRGYKCGSFVENSDIHTELTLALEALGVKRCIQYHGINTENTFQHVAIAVKRIAEVLEERKARLVKRQSA